MVTFFPPSRKGVVNVFVLAVGREIGKFWIWDDYSKDVVVEAVVVD